VGEILVLLHGVLLGDLGLKFLAQPGARFGDVENRSVP